MIVRVKEATQMLCGRYNQMCRGEACMQFRRMDSGSVPGAEERGPVGYCGLGGMPTVKVLHMPVVRGQRGMPEVGPHRGGMVHAGAAVPTIIHTDTPLTARQITPRTRAMERLILQGPDGGKFFEAGGELSPAEAVVRRFLAVCTEPGIRVPNSSLWDAFNRWLRLCEDAETGPRTFMSMATFMAVVGRTRRVEKVSGKIFVLGIELRAEWRAENAALVTPSEDVVLHGSCGECAGEDCPGCVGG